MPRTAAFISGVLQELFRQLEYAPDETHRRQMDAAEHLLEDIESGRLYPEDFIVYRITSYRSDRPGATTAVVGEALRRDLVNFIQRLSWDLDLPPQQPRGDAVAMDEIAVRLGVSRRTLQRCRRDGLVMHWVREESGRRRLSCFPDALDRFLAEHGHRIASASAMNRMDHDEQRHVWTLAEREVQQHPGSSLNEVALRLAVHTGRGHETIRRLLRRFNTAAEVPLFHEHGPLTDRDGRLAVRFRRHGASWTQIADRFGKSEAAVQRAVLRARRRTLAEFMERLEDRPVVWSDEVLEASCATGLPHPARSEQWSFAPLDSNALGHDLDAADMLRHQAGIAMAMMDAVPTVESIDQVETWLRWAAMLHLRGILACWQGVIGVVEDRLRQPIAALPNEQRAELIALAFETISRCLCSESVRRSGDIESSIESMVSSELERRSVDPRPGRASARMDAAIHVLVDVLQDRWPWAAIMPSRFRLGAMRELSADDSRLVERHFGLDGSPPWTMQQLATADSSTPGVVARRLGRFQW